MIENITRFFSVYGSALTSGAVVVSAIAVVVSAIAAVWVVKSNRTIARKRATLDLIMTVESDRDLVEARRKFLEIKRSETRPGAYVRTNGGDNEEFKTIRTVLNINELVAVSIREGVIDERVFRRWFNSAYVEDYNYMRDFIDAVQSTNNNNVYKEFKETAKRWKDDENWR